MGQHHRALSESFLPKSGGAQGVSDGGVAAKIPVTCSIEEQVHQFITPRAPRGTSCHNTLP